MAVVGVRTHGRHDIADQRKVQLPQQAGLTFGGQDQHIVLCVDVLSTTIYLQKERGD